MCLYNHRKMSRPFKLYRLQLIDSQLDKLNLHLEEIESGLQNNTRNLEIAQIVEIQKSTHEKAVKMLRRAEEETQKQLIKIELTETSLYGGKVRKPKELQDLQNEAVPLKRYLHVLEDRQLEAMLAEEHTSHELKEALAQQAIIAAEETKRIQALNQEKTKTLREIESFEKERAASVGAIEPADLAVYTQLRQKRRGIAVSKVDQKACSACGTTLNSALLSAARSPNQLTFCDNCARILYAG